MLRDKAFTPQSRDKKETNSSKLKDARKRFSQMGGRVSGADMVIARAAVETKDAIERLGVLLDAYRDQFTESELEKMKTVRISLTTISARFNTHRETIEAIYKTKLNDKGPEENE